MIIGINVTTHYRGGAIQVAFSIVEELSKIERENKYIVFCLEELFTQLNQLNLPSNVELILIDNSPAKISKRKKIVFILEQFVIIKKIQVILTIFGPSYWKPSVPHICGFADGWCYNPDSIAYKHLSSHQRIKRRLLNIYKIYHLKNEGQLFFLETDDAKKKFASVSGIPENCITVVGNTYNASYLSEETQSLVLPKRDEGEIRFLLLSANQPNKNITILNQVVPLLEKKIKHFHFITTLPQIDYNKIILPHIKPYVLNTGPLSIKRCVQLYREVDFSFLPTLLESFTATYPESMFMKKPILTSDLPFAKDLCRDAALYFNPISPINIVETIMKVLSDETIYQKLISNGQQRVKDFPSASQRARLLLDLCIKTKV
ncbi:MAG: glycosyltransferase [Prolixibacteraceae bacterium]|nr:glycosyltransferase [Prolixibacteraceae bacterium]